MKDEIPLRKEPSPKCDLCKNRPICRFYHTMKDFIRVAEVKEYYALLQYMGSVCQSFTKKENIT